MDHPDVVCCLQRVCSLTFSGLALPHQEGSSSVLQVQKEPLGVAPSDLPKIPPAKVGQGESDQKEAAAERLQQAGRNIEYSCTGWYIGKYTLYIFVW